MPRKRSSSPGPAPLALPPYGYMVGYQHDGALARAYPVKWNAGRAEWNPWFERVLGLIGQNVWPVYREGAWVRSPAADNAIALTLADLAMIREFRDRYFLAPVGATGLYQADCFVAEDLGDGSGWLSSFARSCPELVAPAFSMDKVFEHAIFDYAERFLPECFKLHFQRPRAFQASLLLEQPGAPAFRHSTATSANTPAMISGHGVQSLIVGCVAFEAISADAKLAARNRKQLQAWMTGIGDRRVMAGVHYPSDSLASWIVAAEIVDYLFADPAIRRFLLQAIRDSLLYTFLEARIPTMGAYRLPWKCLVDTLSKSSSKSP